MHDIVWWHSNVCRMIVICCALGDLMQELRVTVGMLVRVCTYIIVCYNCYVATLIGYWCFADIPGSTFSSGNYHTWLYNLGYMQMPYSCRGISQISFVHKLLCTCLPHFLVASDPWWWDTAGSGAPSQHHQQQHWWSNASSKENKDCHRGLRRVHVGSSVLFLWLCFETLLFLLLHTHEPPCH